MSSDKSCFTLLRAVDVSVKSHYVSSTRDYQAVKTEIPAMFAVRWPNGIPCSLVEMYLVHRFRDGAAVNRVDGGSLRATVAKLSHLIRYCWNANCDFWDLDDDHYSQFIYKLTQDRRPGTPSVPSRDGNTVRAISGACIEFLGWLQTELHFRTDLVGHGAGYRIRLSYRTGGLDKARKRHGKLPGTYHRLPPVDTHEPKRPMPSEYRNRLWEAVSSMTEVSVRNLVWCKTPQDSELVSVFLKARRELLLYLLEATGARPGELARLSVLANLDCYKTKKLTISTLKRRRVAYRVIDLQPDVAMRLELFIHGYRAQVLHRIWKEFGVRAGEDSVFLGAHGRPMHERTMTSDFTRIVRTADLGSVQSCMSMFRHRFITKQVALHLQALTSETGAARGMLTESDYRSILKKVAVVTGHGDPNSLLSYIDLAWQELGAFKRVESAQQIEALVESAITRVISLIGDTRARGNHETRVASKALEALEALKRDIHYAVQCGQGA